MARNDAADPSAVDTEGEGSKYEGPMDPGMKGTPADIRAFYGGRRQNAIL